MVVLALHLTKDKKMLKVKLRVPGNITTVSSTTMVICLSRAQSHDLTLSSLTNCTFPFSSHNWNTLFVGTSAVADAIAEKYNTTKSQVLDHVSSTVILFVFSITRLSAASGTLETLKGPSPVSVTDS